MSDVAAVFHLAHGDEWVYFNWERMRGLSEERAMRATLTMKPRGGGFYLFRLVL